MDDVRSLYEVDDEFSRDVLGRRCIYYVLYEFESYIKSYVCVFLSIYVYIFLLPFLLKTSLYSTQVSVNI